MAFPSHPPKTVRGIHLPKRRFAAWAAAYFATFVAAPILGAALVLDVIFYLLTRDGFQACYAILCLFE